MKSELSFSVLPDWMEIDNVHNRAQTFFKSCSFDPDYVDMFTMITCELVENSIKYGDFKNNKTVEVIVKVFQERIIIIVKNPIGDRSKSYLHELDRTIQWIRGFQDPYEAYIHRMKQISMEPMENNKSGLGIARISYEGRATIDFFINAEKILNVSAVSLVK